LNSRATNGIQEYGCNAKILESRDISAKNPVDGPCIH